MSLKIHELICGSFCPVHGLNPFPTETLSCRCLLVETPNSLVLCDTGLPPSEWLKNQGDLHTLTIKPFIENHVPINERIQKLGFKPEDVHHIILTHLHFDHAGALSIFPNAKVHLHANEYEVTNLMSMRKRLKFYSRVWDDETKFIRYDDFGEKWFNFKSVKQLEDLPPEILLVPLIGHTDGHCGVAIRSTDRWILHAGDAFYFQEDLSFKLTERNLASDAIQTALATRNRDRFFNLLRLADLKKRPEEVYITNSHDPRLSVS